MRSIYTGFAIVAAFGIVTSTACNPLKKMNKKGASMDEMKDAASNGSFHILSFILGLLLGLLGVLIVYLVWRDRSRTISAWWGVLVIVILAVIGAVV